jgi:hypothetical protein
VFNEQEHGQSFTGTMRQYQTSLARDTLQQSQHEAVTTAHQRGDKLTRRNASSQRNCINMQAQISERLYFFC